jgi:hypothetical protein
MGRERSRALRVRASARLQATKETFVKAILASLALAIALLAAPATASTAPGSALDVVPEAAWAQARCTARQVRTSRPGGGVVVRTVRDCRPARVERCRVERRRAIRPSGRVVVRTVRTCR